MEAGFFLTVGCCRWLLAVGRGDTHGMTYGVRPEAEVIPGFPRFRYGACMELVRSSLYVVCRFHFRFRFASIVGSVDTTTRRHGLRSQADSGAGARLTVYGFLYYCPVNRIESAQDEDQDQAANTSSSSSTVPSTLSLCPPPLSVKRGCVLTRGVHGLVLVAIPQREAAVCECSIK
ncbi:hypothetical protein BZA05DRAFT_417430 [Tricharina praecox]|uniref:uncharacterized protein n=1 Tax=Tricharina praecox TaxID=43433 RepID=UPI0022208A9E|nr:uncharacterized protein BZA05DRAFT_417430 [Tricharina praecox]KAI5854955.1 hypothetical protein BZA05DRAFT_417430 [Tricharina praecox]